METVELNVAGGASPDERHAIIGGLVAYNDAAATSGAHRELSVVARAEGEIVGGLVGWTNWSWLFIAQLWVAEAARGCGIGGQLVAAAEREAIGRGCRHAHLDTFGFQALPFYQRAGYQIFGQLEDYPAGETRYFLQKRNLKPDI